MGKIAFDNRHRSFRYHVCALRESLFPLNMRRILGVRVCVRELGAESDGRNKRLLVAHMRFSVCCTHT